MNTEQEILEVTEEDFSEEITKRKESIRKRSNIVFISLLIIFITRFFAKYADFNVALNSTVLVVLLAFCLFYAAALRMYLESLKVHQKDAMTNMLLKRFNDVLDLIVVIPIFITIITILNISILSVSNVEGSSMEPNFSDQDDILIYHPPGMNYERFDVVILKVNTGDYYIKRIIGLPGETIQIDNNTILVDGVALDEAELGLEEETFCNVTYGDNCEFTVPEGSYFVLGDNRTSSNDSRSVHVSYVEEKDLFGKVIFHYQNIFRTQEE